MGHPTMNTTRNDRHWRSTGHGLLVTVLCLLPLSAAGQQADTGTRVTVESDGWALVGDLVLPAGTAPVPAVLMLNAAASDRTPYAPLAGQLADRDIASLRLDLRGHGESVNLGRFVPGEHERDPLIWDAEADVVAALAFLRSLPRIDGARLGVVGASYSGEEMAEAGRLRGYARAYVALSPGSFSDESVAAIDASGASWLLVVSRDERYLTEVTAAVRAGSRTAEVLILPGTQHGTRILPERPDVAERVAVWLAGQLAATSDWDAPTRLSDPTRQRTRR
jgi:dienelactone hydrolase